MLLYLILFLHQTTTTAPRRWESGWLYLILFLHQTTTCKGLDVPLNPLYLILFLHQTTTTSLGKRGGTSLYLILFLHQTTTVTDNYPTICCCISSYSYIKPQRMQRRCWAGGGCISSYSYIKPQLFITCGIWKPVVSHLIPTSNHNVGKIIVPQQRLYLILFLHQTTTRHTDGMNRCSCISSYSYIKPQLAQRQCGDVCSCISSYSYIKPQRHAGQ